MRVPQVEAEVELKDLVAVPHNLILARIPHCGGFSGLLVSISATRPSSSKPWTC